MSQKKLVLASASPRRRELLKSLNLKFEVIPSTAEEDIEGKEFCEDLIKGIALDKAKDVAQKISSPAIIIAADTVVVIDKNILGKPKDKKDAFRMLKMLSAKEHIVVSAIAIIDTEKQKTLVDIVKSSVKFREIEEEEINSYIKTSESLDKSGSYSIQGIAGIFVISIAGSYSNIVGLCVYKIAQMLKELGFNILN